MLVGRPRIMGLVRRWHAVEVEGPLLQAGTRVIMVGHHGWSCPVILGEHVLRLPGASIYRRTIPFEAVSGLIAQMAVEPRKSVRARIKRIIREAARSPRTWRQT